VREGDLIDDRFELHAIVGEGQMGVVHRAFDRRAALPVAVKFLASHRDVERARFARESEVLASLEHDGIVRHVAHGTAGDGTPYLAMEWIEGQDLSVRLQAGALPVAETIALARAVAEALASAHARGIVHRDVKPSNVLLLGGSTASPKLVDFGVARMLGRATALTRTGRIVGTPAYMAPEQIQDGGTIDELVDVFALGCVIHQCLAGRPPFSGVDVRVVFAQIMFGEAPSLRGVRDDVPPALEALVQAMMEKDSARRPRTCTEVAAALASQ
jgi:serine/threonine protein kinase